MMKSSRTICRLILPLLFAALLAAGALLIVFSSDPANDDIAEDILRFDLIPGDGKAAQVCAWSENGTDYFLFLPSFAGPDTAVFAPVFFNGTAWVMIASPFRRFAAVPFLPRSSYSFSAPYRRPISYNLLIYFSTFRRILLCHRRIVREKMQNPKCAQKAGRR